MVPDRCPFIGTTLEFYKTINGDWLFHLILHVLLFAKILAIFDIFFVNSASKIAKHFHYFMVLKNVFESTNIYEYYQELDLDYYLTIRYYKHRADPLLLKKNLVYGDKSLFTVV